MMIDTVVLNIPQGKYKLLDYEVFTPSAKGLFEAPLYSLQTIPVCCAYNPTYNERNNYGGYLPRLTLVKCPKYNKKTKKSPFQTHLKIEFSAPKLLLGNNFSELENKDFDDLIEKLQEALKFMKVEVSKKDLRISKVHTIHYSKNIVLGGHILCSQAIELMGKGCLNSQMQNTKTIYQNKGKAVRFRNKKNELVFYDKIKDLEHAKVKAHHSIEGCAYMSSNCSLSHAPKNLQVFRVEARFLGSIEIKKICKKVGIQIPIESTFADLFDEKKSQTILQHYMKIIEDSLYVHCIPLSNNTKNDIELLLNANPTRQKRTILQLFSIIQMSKECSIEDIRDLLGYAGKKGSQEWGRIKKDIKSLNIPRITRNHIIKEIETQLDKFSAVKIENYF